MKDFFYWKSQIQSAKDALKDYRTDAREAEELYCDDTLNYNLFYSNVQILDSHLCLTNPKPDIQKRFSKFIESDKRRSNLYSEVAKIVSSATEYVVDVSSLNESMKKSVHNNNVCGRGVIWIDYEPEITKTPAFDEFGNPVLKEVVSNRKIICESLNYQEFLQSTSDKEENVWWKARRHLLTRQDIEKRFGYKPSEEEMQFETEKDDETSAKRAEVWEIWDKSEKKRIFLMLSDNRKTFLEVQDDPYKLSIFFPCWDICWLYKEGSLIPVPEVMVYKKKLDLLETVNKKIAQITDEIKYVTIVGSQDKKTMQALASAKNGDVISMPTTDVQGSLAQSVAMMPADRAVVVLDNLEQIKERTKKDIYDITGISDIMRGATDARETASAQMIKGLFGTLRFQERQKAVNLFRKHIYEIIAEIICEHYDMETLQEITSTHLPTQEEKLVKEAELKQQEMSGKEVDQQTIDEYNRMLFLPSWEEVMAVIQSDKLRSYTIDIETTATAFDDRELQNASITALTQTYLALVNSVNTLPSPDLVKGFIPIMKMNLMNIKVSNEIGRQLEDAIESTYRQIEMASKTPAPPSPEVIAAQNDTKRADADLAKTKGEIDYKQAELALKQKELSIKEQEVYRKETELKKQYENDIDYKRAELELKKQELEIKQQEADRKETELQMQYDLKQKEIRSGVNINTNIAGDVASLE